VCGCVSMSTGYIRTILDPARLEVSFHGDLSALKLPPSHCLPLQLPPLEILWFTYPHKTTKLGVLEKLWNDRSLELDWVLHDKGFPIVRPAGDLRVACINHMIGF
jgi:hypothetical protein